MKLRHFEGTKQRHGEIAGSIPIFSVFLNVLEVSTKANKIHWDNGLLLTCNRVHVRANEGDENLRTGAKTLWTAFSRFPCNKQSKKKGTSKHVDIILYLSERFFSHPVNSLNLKQYSNCARYE